MSGDRKGSRRSFTSENEMNQRFEHDENRGKWATKTEFLLSCIGYAVGIGNVWRFPYLCYRSGGGAFLIPYLLMLFFCGIPLFFMEIIIGQFSSTGCIEMFRLAPILKGTGYAIVVVNMICTCYFSVIISYPIMFLKRILNSDLPWDTCDNSWNTDRCVEVLELSKHNYTDSNSFRTPADEFFHLEMLKISSGIEHLGSIVWPLLWCLLFTWVVVYLSIIKGIKTVGKVVYFTATFPFFILIVLFIRGITLPGAMTGIIYYIKPEWSRLLDLKVWADAAIQIFFSLGPGWGGIVNMSSFNKFHNNAKSDAILIPIVNCSTSIFAGFVVFSVLGYLSELSGIPVADVATSGPGLAFVTYPQAIAMLPMPHIWAGMFFFMLFLLGLDSVFVQIEAIISSVLDEVVGLRKYKFIVTLGSCLTMFLLSVVMVTEGGMYILQLLDWYSASISVILICIIEVVIVGWLYGIDNFTNDIYTMLGKYPGRVWILCWKYFTPVILIGIFFTSIAFNRNVSYNRVEYPSWAIAVGWCSCAASIIWIPLYFLYTILSKDGSVSSIIKYYSKAIDWSPADAQHKSEYERFLKSRNKEHEMDVRV